MSRIIHVYFKESKKNDYFGSLLAIYDHYTREEMGITYNYLRNSLLKQNPVETKTAIIDIGHIKRKQQSAPKSDSPTEA